MISNKNYIPGDTQFRALAEWARKRNVRLIFFIPPLRPDLLKIKLSLGFDKHIEDLEATAKEYHVELVQMQDSAVLLGNDLGVSSDEDHLVTCKGAGVMSLYLSDIVRRQNTESLAPKENLTERARKLCNMDKDE